MKKFLLLVLTFALVMSACIGSALAATTADLPQYGQVTKIAYNITTAPVIDGVVNEGEYGEVFHTFAYDPADKSQYWNGIEESDTFKLADVLPEKVTFT